jgi:hypothetical protein
VRQTICIANNWAKDMKSYGQHDKGVNEVVSYEKAKSILHEKLDPHFCETFL